MSEGCKRCVPNAGDIIVSVLAGHHEMPEELSLIEVECGLVWLNWLVPSKGCSPAVGHRNSTI